MLEVRRALNGTFVCFLLLLTTAFAGAQTHARGMRFDLNIPSQSLDAALQTFAVDSRHRLLYRSELVEGRVSPALHGTFTVEEAMSVLLRGTDLTFEVTPSAVVLIRSTTLPDSQSGNDSGGADTTGASLSLPAAAQPPLRLAQAEATRVPAGTGSATDANENKQLEEIVVTGTQIRGVSAPVGSASIPLGREEIARAGAVTMTDILRNIPAMTGLGGEQVTSTAGASQQNSFKNGRSARATNLRGLGPQSTLVMLEGHRVAPGTLFFDLDNIPSAAIERIEVVADGASAIYGSEAVAGVVNLKLRRRFEGAETAVRYGFADGADTTLVSQVIGKGWDGGNAMLTYEYTANSALEAGDRPRLFDDDARPYGGNPPSTSASPGNIISGAGATQSVYQIPSGQNGQSLLLSQLSAGAPRYQSIWEGTTVIPEQHRHSVLGTLTQNITDGLDLSVEAFYSKRSFERRSTAASAGAGGLSVPSSNPFSPCNPSHSQAGNPGINCTTNLRVLYSYLDDLGNAQLAGHVANGGITAGLEADLFSDWRAQLNVTYAQAEEADSTRNSVNTAQLDRALGNTVAGTVKPDNVPYFNPFCDGSAFSCNDPATLDYIRGSSGSKFSYELEGIALKADGSLFPGPGGDVRLAVGGEYHSDRMRLIARNSNSSPSNTLQQVADNGASRYVKAAFAEVYVPLVMADSEIPLVRELELSAAGRYEDYSDFGETTNPKFGVNWVPLDGLKFHASYGKSFRAPALNDTNSVVGGRITPNNVQASQVGLPGNSTLSIIQLGGGREGLQPETATTWSFGFELRPRGSGFEASLNYYDIDYDDVITNPPLLVGLAPTLNAAPLYDRFVVYNPAYFPTRTSMSQADYDAYIQSLINSTNPPITRVPSDPALVIAVVDGKAANAGTVQTSGLDFSTRYAWDSALGTWRVGALGTYVFEWKTSAVEGAALLDQINHFGYPLRLRARGELGWNLDGLGVTAYVNYTNGYEIDRLYLPAAATAQYEKIDSYTTVDLTLNYDTGTRPASDIFKNVALNLSVQNVADEDPPLVLNVTNSPILFDPFVASPYGRMASFQVTKRW